MGELLNWRAVNTVQHEVLCVMWRANSKIRFPISDESHSSSKILPNEKILICSLTSSCCEMDLMN